VEAALTADPRVHDEIQAMELVKNTCSTLAEILDSRTQTIEAMRL
jgi:hypothetical protein